MRDLKLQVGGTINPRRHVYIQRKEIEKELLQSLLEAEPCNILSSRQVGKSSLIVRTAQHLHSQGIRVAQVDIAGELGSVTLTSAESWYEGLLCLIAGDIDLELDTKKWWESSTGTPNQKLLRFFRDAVFEKDETPIVIFLDEIDGTFKLPFRDDLFTALRNLYNDRARTKNYEKMTICLVGVATISELILDKRITPYNIGKQIELRDFDYNHDDLRALVEYLQVDRPTGEDMLRAILHWTGGHPYLTLYFCQEVNRRGFDSSDQIDSFINNRLVDRVSARMNNEHFQQIVRFFGERISDQIKAFRIYRAILKRSSVRDKETTTHLQLKRSGLVLRNTRGRLVIRNRIYRHVFDDDWARRSRPLRSVEALRRTAAVALVAIIVALAVLAFEFGIAGPRQRAVTETIIKLNSTEDIPQANALLHVLRTEPWVPPDFEEDAERGFWKRTLKQAAWQRLVTLSNASSYSEVEEHLRIIQEGDIDGLLPRYAELMPESVKETLKFGDILNPDDLEAAQGNFERRLFDISWMIVAASQLNAEPSEARRLLSILENEEPSEILEEAERIQRAGEESVSAARYRVELQEEGKRGQDYFLGLSSGRALATASGEYEAPVPELDRETAAFYREVLRGAALDKDLGRVIRGFEDRAAVAWRYFQWIEEDRAFLEARIRMQEVDTEDEINQQFKIMTGQLEIDGLRITPVNERTLLASKLERRARTRVLVEEILDELSVESDSYSQADKLRSWALEELEALRDLASRDNWRDAELGDLVERFERRVSRDYARFEERMRRAAVQANMNWLVGSKPVEDDYQAVYRFRVLAGRQEFSQGGQDILIEGKEDQAADALRRYFISKAEVLEQKHVETEDERLIIRAASLLRRGENPEEILSSSSVAFQYLLATIRFENIGVRAAEFWHRGQTVRVITGHPVNGAVLAWDIGQALPHHHKILHSEKILAIDVSPSSQYIATASADNSVH